MVDVPLADAVVLWTPDGSDELPPVAVVRRGSANDEEDYLSSWGYHNEEFREAPMDQKLCLLLAKAIFIGVEERVPARAVHAALSVIPEYRAALADAGLVFEG